MNYRFKLFISFTLLVFFCTFFALGVTYKKSRELLLNQIRSHLLSVAVSSATSINGDILATFQTRASEKTADYLNLIKELTLIRDNNRASNLFINYIYIIRQIKGDQFIYIADAKETDFKDVTRFGDSFQITKNDGFITKPNQAFCETTRFEDQWGVWFSAYAPIFDSHGVIQGYLGVDLSASIVDYELNKLLLYGIFSLGISILLAFVISHILSKKLSRSLLTICTCVEEIRKGNLKARVYLSTKDEIQRLGTVINLMADDLEEKERLTINFGRYVSHHVLEKILKSNNITKLEGEKRKVSILFSDIRHFTTLSECSRPEDVVSFLNEYFEKMIEIIFTYHGTLDKFIGDGIMAEFGVPLDDAYQELNAVKAAIEMQKMLKKLSLKWKGTKYENVKIGIGIHTGLAIVGNIGSNQRMEYTAVGDTVNVASRLESMTKDVEKDVLISKETYEAIKNNEEFLFEYLGEIQVKGRTQSIPTYSVTVKTEPNANTL